MDNLLTARRYEEENSLRPRNVDSIGGAPRLVLPAKAGPSLDSGALRLAGKTGVPADLQPEYAN